MGWKKERDGWSEEKGKGRNRSGGGEGFLFKVWKPAEVQQAEQHAEHRLSEHRAKALIAALAAST